MKIQSIYNVYCYNFLIFNIIIFLLSQITFNRIIGGHSNYSYSYSYGIVFQLQLEYFVGEIPPLSFQSLSTRYSLNIWFKRGSRRVLLEFPKFLIFSCGCSNFYNTTSCKIIINSEFVFDLAQLYTEFIFYIQTVLEFTK